MKITNSWKPFTPCGFPHIILIMCLNYWEIQYKIQFMPKLGKVPFFEPYFLES